MLRRFLRFRVGQANTDRDPYNGIPFVSLGFDPNRETRNWMTRGVAGTIGSLENERINARPVVSSQITNPSKIQNQIPSPTRALQVQHHISPIYITDKKTRCRYLIDTGAEVSVLPRPSHIDPATFRPDPSEPTPSLFAANRTPIATFGFVRVVPNLGLRRSQEHRFIYADVPQPIIGLDFLRKYKLLIDPVANKLIDTETGLGVSGQIAHQHEYHSIKVIKIASPFSEIIQKFPEVNGTGATEPFLMTTPKTKHHIVTTGPPVTARARRLCGI